MLRCCLGPLTSPVPEEVMTDSQLLRKKTALSRLIMRLTYVDGSTEPFVDEMTPKDQLIHDWQGAETTEEDRFDDGYRGQRLRGKKAILCYLAVPFLLIYSFWFSATSPYSWVAVTPWMANVLPDNNGEKMIYDYNDVR